jgi:hypothetical protein
MSDNFYLDLVSESRSHFDAALRVIFTRFEKVSHYAIDRDQGLLLFEKQPAPGPYPFVIQPLANPLLGASGVMPFLWNWLCESAVYLPLGDSDMVAKKGFHITTGRPWEKVLGIPECVMALRPEWIHEAVAVPQAAPLRAATTLPLRQVKP